MKGEIKKKLQFMVYKKIEKGGYRWIKEGQSRAMRDIFEIPKHIPSSQIVEFIKEYRRKEKRDVKKKRKTTKT